MIEKSKSDELMEEQSVNSRSSTSKKNKKGNNPII